MIRNQSKAVIPVRKPTKGPRKKRARPDPREFTVADLERAAGRFAISHNKQVYQIML